MHAFKDGCDFLGILAHNSRSAGSWEVGTSVLGDKKDVLVLICTWMGRDKANVCMGGDKHVVSYCICAEDVGCEPSVDMEGVMEVVLFPTCTQREDAQHLANFVFSFLKYSLDTPGRLVQIQKRSPPLSWCILTLERDIQAWCRSSKGHEVS